MVSATLEVAQYESTGAGCGHWAFYVVVTDGGMTTEYLFEIENRSGQYKFDSHIGVDPMSSRRFLRKVWIGQLDDRDVIEKMEQYLKDHPISTAAQWSCQDWIIEAVHAIYEEEFIRQEEYYDALEILEDDFRKF